MSDGAGELADGTAVAELIGRLRERLTVHFPSDPANTGDMTTPMAVRRMMKERAEAADALARLERELAETRKLVDETVQERLTLTHAGIEQLERAERAAHR